VAESTTVGTRIREKRVALAMKQTDLAKAVGISPSYLNLIEHNRRRIGGKTLLNIAEVLDVEPTLLSEGAEATLVAVLQEAAGDQKEHSAELERIEEFAGRFPGWAGLVAELHLRIGKVERSVQELTDRLAHDPHLADSLHEVISSVTSIRSTASILVDTREIEAEWQNRFHRNINEDSRRLTESAQALVKYLEAAPDPEIEIRSPQDELQAVLSNRGFHFEEIESAVDPLDAVAGLEEDLSGLWASEAARSLARVYLTEYAEDVSRLPMSDLLRAISLDGLDPQALSARLGAHLTLVFRRLAAMPEAEVGPIGLIASDGAGGLVSRKPIDGFGTPRVAGACALWPLFQIMGQPHSPMRVRLRQVGRHEITVLSMTAMEPKTQATFDLPALPRAYMLLLPDNDSPKIPTRDIGVTCRVCPRSDCVARREPSIMAEGF
jgi:transcriptional regulator with XRE-family HTH domain